MKRIIFWLVMLVFLSVGTSACHYGPAIGCAVGAEAGKRANKERQVRCEAIEQETDTMVKEKLLMRRRADEIRIIADNQPSKSKRSAKEKAIRQTLYNEVKATIKRVDVMVARTAELRADAIKNDCK